MTIDNELQATYEKWLNINQYREVGLPTYAESGTALLLKLSDILRTRVQAAVDAERKRSDEWMEQECGIDGYEKTQKLKDEFDDMQNRLASIEDPNYRKRIKLDARIAEAHLAHGQKHSSYACGFEEHCWYRERIAALTSERDALGKDDRK